MTPAEFNQWLSEPRRRTLVMGVLNVTPDSFSDGGQFATVEAAAAHAHRLADQGADLIDIGGESTRPGSVRVAPDEQIRRVLPVIRALCGRLAAVLSVDTTRAAVAREALDAGATVINDVSAGTDDPDMLSLAGARQAPIILMHMKGQPATMQQDPRYQDVVREVAEYLECRRNAAIAAGIPRERILLDPGIGFGKTVEHNLALLRHLKNLCGLGCPVVVGTSRKAFIGRITGESDPVQRVFGTSATVAWSVANGAAIVRVHDVEPAVRVVRMIEAIMGEDRPNPPGLSRS
jgi:dihydropteroate synthase